MFKIKYPNILKLVLSQSISTLGNQVAALAIPWIVLERTGSASQTGLVAFTTGVAAIGGALIGGVLVDRFGPKRVSIVADLLSSVTLLLIPLFVFLNFLPLWLLIFLQFFGTLFDAPGATARDTMVPNVAKEDDLPIIKVGSYQEATQGLAQLVGPLIGGLAITSIGSSNTLVITAFLFVITALIVSRIILRKHKHTSTGKKFEVINEFKQGLSFIKKDKLILNFTIIGTFFVAIFAPLATVILPSWFNENNLTASSLGIFLAVQAVGLVIGSILFSSISTKVSITFWFNLTNFSGVILYILLIAFTPGSIPSLIISFILGLSSAGLFPIINNVYYKKTPESILGRVNGTTSAIVLAVAPLFSLSAGFIVERLGTIPMFVIIIMTYLLLSTYVFLNPIFKELDKISRD